MAAPFIRSLSDSTPEEGQTGITILGGDFGFWLGEVWMFQNADGSGLSDQLTIAGGQADWGDMGVTNVAIPAAPNNNPGTVYIAIKTSGNEWSIPAFPFPVTLVEAGVGPASIVHIWRPPMHATLRRMMR